MFTILADGKALWSPVVSETKVGSPKLQLEVNKVGTLSFDILPTHPLYDSLAKLKTIITVKQDEDVLFQGRIFSDKADWYKAKAVQCEGLLGCLNDSTVRPYTYTGSVEGYVRMLLDQHNSQVKFAQRIFLGNVTVTDPNDYITRANSSYPNTWKELTEKCVKLMGGYLVARYEADGVYLDYLKEFPVSTQSVQFGINLLDLTNEVSGENVATRIIPLGARIEDENEQSTDKRVDITSVNDGKDYVEDAAAVAKWGIITKVMTWDDVNVPSILKSKAEASLATAAVLSEKRTIKALDLHLTDAQVERLRLGQRINLFSGPHNISDTVMLASYTLDLAKPSNCTITTSAENNTLTDRQMQSNINIAASVTNLTQVVNGISQDTITALENANTAKETAEATNNTLLTSYYTSTQVDNKITANNEAITSEMTETTKTIISDSVKDTTSTDSIGSAIKQSKDEVSATVTALQGTVDDMGGQVSQNTASIKTTSDSMTSSVSSINARLDGVGDTTTGLTNNITDIQSQIADYSEYKTMVEQQAGKIEVIASEYDSLNTYTKTASVEIDPSGLSVQTSSTGSTKTTVDGEGVTVRDPNGEQLVKFTLGLSHIDRVQIDHSAIIGAHQIQAYEDAEADGTSTIGTAWFWCNDIEVD